MTKLYTSEAIILARRNFSEADRILVAFSKNLGKVSLLAKGVRYPKSRKRGHLEAFNVVKFQATHGKGIDILTEAETIISFPKIRKNLKKASVAYFLVETVGKTTQDEAKHEDIYTLLLETLKKVEESEDLKVLREKFVAEILVYLGFWPKGKPLENPDQVLENIMERKIHSIRVGKKILT